MRKLSKTFKKRNSGKNPKDVNVEWNTWKTLKHAVWIADIGVDAAETEIRKDPEKWAIWRFPLVLRTSCAPTTPFFSFWEGRHPPRRPPGSAWACACRGSASTRRTRRARRRSGRTYQIRTVDKLATQECRKVLPNDQNCACKDHENNCAIQTSDIWWYLFCNLSPLQELPDGQVQESIGLASRVSLLFWMECADGGKRFRRV